MVFGNFGAALALQGSPEDMKTLPKERVDGTVEACEVGSADMEKDTIEVVDNDGW